jgi:hypothetical protein
MTGRGGTKQAFSVDITVLLLEIVYLDIFIFNASREEFAGTGGSGSRAIFLMVRIFFPTEGAKKITFSGSNPTRKPCRRVHPGPGTGFAGPGLLFSYHGSQELL